jgi:imidazolonepropionase-like amidohydrolase
MCIRRFLAVALFIALVVPVFTQPAPKSSLIRAGRLLDVRAGTYRAGQGIWVEGERIKQVGPFDAVRVAAPKDVTTLDLSRATVLPGLIDCHAHLLAGMDPENGPGDNLILTITRDSPAKRALLGAAMARELLEGGFTSVRNVGHSGIDGDVSLRDAIRSGWITGPRVAATGRKIAPHGGQAVRVQTGLADAIVDQEFLTASNPDEGRRAVLENLRIGTDAIKVVADDWPRVIGDDTLKAIADEAHRVSIRVAAHATTKPGIQAAVAAGVDSIEHGNEATDEQFATMKAKGTVLVPTLWPRDMLPVSRALRARPDLDTLIDRYVATERAKLERARKAGVTIAFGSDMWFGYTDKTRGRATLLVLEALQSYGMTPADALRSATVNAADLINLTDVTGAVETGKYADLIAVDGDPLTNLRDLENPKFVMKSGIVVRHDHAAGR